MDFVKALVKDYISLDNELSEHNKKVKEIRQKRNVTGDKLKTYMEENDLTVINTADEIIKIKKSKTMKNSVTKKVCIETLLEHINDHDTIDYIVQNMFEGEETAEETTKISRSKK
jgi:seryl-tRNA synthetase